MRLFYLDFLRLILAFYVVQYHVFEQLHKGTAKLLQGSFLAVDCFFILSAFVLTKQFVETKLIFSKFLVQRIARIFPLFLLSFVLIIAVLNIDVVENLYDFITQFFLIHSLGFADGHLGWNYPSWTLGLEFWLSIGLIYFLVKKIESQKQKEGIFMVIIFVLFAISILFIRFKNGNFDIHIDRVFSIANIGVVRCVIGFLIGILTYYTSISEFVVLRLSKANLYVFVCEIILLFLLFLCFLNGGKNYSFLCVFVLFPFVVLVASARQEVSILNKIFSLPILREFGNFSYGVYLLHVPILYVMANFGWFMLKNPHLQTIILCVMVFFVSVPVYYFYEKKAKKFLIEKLS